MPHLAALGNRVSQLLHSFVFSFPSPLHNGSAESHVDVAAHERPVPPAPEISKAYASVSASSLLNEPGETRAIAGGVGPLSFAGSGYGITLVIMAILLNRIHHIVQRPRPPPPPLPHPPTSAYRRLGARHTPHYLRLPGLFCLVRAWTLFSILTLQVAGCWPVESSRLAQWRVGRLVVRAGDWAGQMEMQRACWQVFVSVCAGLVCGALANGLDRARRRDVGASFNLVRRLVVCVCAAHVQFGYSFLLHLYSSPLTHHVAPRAAQHGRPDIHALFQLWLSLTELTWLQAIELSPALRRNQLLPTTVCGTMGLVHFVYALLHSPWRFPSFTFLTHLVALFLCVIIAFTIILKAFTHVFTLGYIPSPMLASVLPHTGVIPSIEDDFGVALLKLGTACIEATSYSGLRNELAAVEERHEPWVELSPAGGDVVKARHAAGGLAMRIDDIRASDLEDPNADNPYMRELHAFRGAVISMLAEAFWAGLTATPGGLRLYGAIERQVRGRWWYGPRGWRVWRREVWAGPPLLAGVTPHTPRARSTRRVPVPPPGSIEDGDRLITFGQVTRGEIELPGWASDDGEWEDDESASSAGSVSDGEDESGELYRDLMTPSRVSREHTLSRDDHADEAGDEADPTMQPILLAHLTTQSASPLTRRRYAAITAPRAQGGDGWADVVLARRGASAPAGQDEWDEERRRTCVVCMVSHRDVILWPCRCLLMCNDCRESLAARLSAKDHMCPHCRTKVEGYSRIYVP